MTGTGAQIEVTRKLFGANQTLRGKIFQLGSLLLKTRLDSFG